jgi:hypothetical protein
MFVIPVRIWVLCEKKKKDAQRNKKKRRQVINQAKHS